MVSAADLEWDEFFWMTKTQIRDREGDGDAEVEQTGEGSISRIWRSVASAATLFR